MLGERISISRDVEGCWGWTPKGLSTLLNFAGGVHQAPFYTPLERKHCNFSFMGGVETPILQAYGSHIWYLVGQNTANKEKYRFKDASHPKNLAIMF